MAQPSDSTGDQANQLHHTDSGRDQLGIAQPRRRAVDRGATRLLTEQARDLGIGEGLEEAHDHRDDPHQESELPGGAGNAADREQDEGGNAARHPERTPPVNGAPQLLTAANRNCFGRHVDLPSHLAGVSFHQCRETSNRREEFFPRGNSR
jgi:hypothetical protein